MPHRWGLRRTLRNTDLDQERNESFGIKLKIKYSQKLQFLVYDTIVCKFPKCFEIFWFSNRNFTIKNSFKIKKNYKNSIIKIKNKNYKN